MILPSTPGEGIYLSRAAQIRKISDTQSKQEESILALNTERIIQFEANGF